MPVLVCAKIPRDKFEKFDPIRYSFDSTYIKSRDRPLISVDKGALIFTAPFYSRTGGSTSPYLSVLAGNVRKKSFRFWRYNRFYLLFSFHPPRWCTATPDPRQLFTFYLSMYPYIYMHTGLETGKFNDLPMKRYLIKRVCTICIRNVTHLEITW